MDWKNQINQALAGDEQAREALYRGTLRLAFFFARQYTSSQADAEDIVQNAYIQVFSHMHQLKNRDAFIPWLKQIVTNEAIRFLRRARPDVLEEFSEEVLYQESGDPVHEVAPVQATLEKEVLTDLFRKMLAKLPTGQRLALTMFYFEQLPLKEIAQKLNCSDNAIKNRLFHGRKSLERLVLQEEQEHGVRLYSANPLALFLVLCRHGLSLELEESFIQLTAQVIAQKSGLCVLSKMPLPSANPTPPTQYGFRSGQTASARRTMPLNQAASAGATPAQASVAAKAGAAFISARTVALILAAATLLIGGGLLVQKLLRPEPTPPTVRAVSTRKRTTESEMSTRPPALAPIQTTESNITVQTEPVKVSKPTEPVKVKAPFPLLATDPYIRQFSGNPGGVWLHPTLDLKLTIPSDTAREYFVIPEESGFGVYHRSNLFIDQTSQKIGDFFLSHAEKTSDLNEGKNPTEQPTYEFVLEYKDGRRLFKTTKWGGGGLTTPLFYYDSEFDWPAFYQKDAPLKNSDGPRSGMISVGMTVTMIDDRETEEKALAELYQPDPGTLKEALSAYGRVISDFDQFPLASNLYYLASSQKLYPNSPMSDLSSKREFGLYDLNHDDIPELILLQFSEERRISMTPEYLIISIFTFDRGYIQLVDNWAIGSTLESDGRYATEIIMREDGWFCLSKAQGRVFADNILTQTTYPASTDYKRQNLELILNKLNEKFSIYLDKDKASNETSIIRRFSSGAPYHYINQEKPQVKTSELSTDLISLYTEASPDGKHLWDIFSLRSEYEPFMAQLNQSFADGIVGRLIRFPTESVQPSQLADALEQSESRLVEDGGRQTAMVAIDKLLHSEGFKHEVRSVREWIEHDPDSLERSGVSLEFDSWPDQTDDTSTQDALKLTLSQVDLTKYPTVGLYVRVKTPENKTPAHIDAARFSLAEKNTDEAAFRSQKILRAVQLNQTEKMSIHLVADTFDRGDAQEFSDLKNTLKKFMQTVQFEVGDQVELTTFASFVSTLQDFTNDRSALIQAIDQMTPFSGSESFLYDALYYAIQSTAVKQNAKCIIAVITGSGSSSQISLKTVLADSLRYRIPIHIVQLEKIAEQSGELKNLFEQAGGSIQYVSSVEQIGQAIDRIYQTEKEMYLIEYITDRTQAPSDIQRNFQIRVQSNQPSQSGEVNTAGQTETFSYVPHLLKSTEAELHETDEISEILDIYLKGFIRALEKQDIAELGQAVINGSPIYQEQERYIKRRDITEELVSYELLEKNISGDECTIKVRENYLVRTLGTPLHLHTQLAHYRLKKTASGWRFHSFEEPVQVLEQIFQP